MENIQIKIILIESDPEYSSFIKNLLSEVENYSFNLECYSQLPQDLNFIIKRGIDLVLLDLSWPDSKGLDIFTKLQTQVSEVPAVLLVDLSDETSAIKAIKKGAQDYLLKEQLDKKLLLHVVYCAIERTRVLKSKYLVIENLNAKLEERVQEEVEKSRQKDLLMIHQSRLAAMGEVIGLIAHQWRQPLNALNLLLYNLKNLFDKNTMEEKTFNDLISRGTNLIMKMSVTIDDFRNFFKPNKGKEAFSITKIIKESFSMVDASFKYNEISVLVNEEKITTVGFPNEYSQVILNILNNAKDAIIAKGVKGEIIIDISQENSSAVVKIRDNGGGIPANFLNSIFDPDFTTKQEGKGTGLGLYMSKVIIENHMGGRINVRNTDVGTEFSIITPLI